ncbi:UDP-galactopyranose mutase [Gorillibacterium sp. CAU 1737]|uniref:UDP-galactopyranose mutase n=1 Tax=Gorillibacterium sp. CAU 1737 TaxID=3140362 RepID=UPI003261312B
MIHQAVIIGSGFAGSILARELSEAGLRVLVVDKRDHIAGNMYDELDETGILIQRYGPHSFHTNDKEVYDYICKYAEFRPNRLTYRAVVNGIEVPCPFNFTSIEMLYPADEAADLINRLQQAFPGQQQVAIFELLESKDEKIHSYAKMLFEEDFRPYTAKQWGRKPEEVDPSVIRRVPILLNRRDSYFDDQYEVHPVGGYTKLFERMLDHAAITVELNIDALEHLRLDEEKGRAVWKGDENIPVFYTGPIDELFDCCFGKLPYRSLHFEWKTKNVDSYQETAIVAWPKDKEYTRITEFSKLPVQETRGKTVIALEYPLPYDKSADRGNEPYYPISNLETAELRSRYQKLASHFDNLVLCGRLADYKYYNMEDVVRRTLDVVKTWVRGNWQ